jgi:autotransporter-associated beta strand protein/T5SS/PEP-CTERM-associated repeat protein
MKPKFNAVRFRNQIGTPLVTVIVVCLSGAVQAADWLNSGSTDWNTASNWNPAGVPNGVAAVINTNTGSIATISVNPTSNPGDLIVGTGGGMTGRLDHLGGTLTTGSWVKIGHNGATGVYNLANTAGTGGTFSGFAQGSGSLNLTGGEFRLGGDSAGGGTGTLNMHTTGGVTVNNGAVAIGQNGNGVLNIDSGTFAKSGSGNIVVSNTSGVTGAINISGGTLSNNGEFQIGNGGGSNGTVTLNAGAITTNSWVSIGRTGGSGAVNVNGGTLTKTGGGSFIVGDDSSGILTQTAGVVDTQTGEFWVGTGGNSTGNYNLSTGTLNTFSWTVIGRNGGTGTMTMTGGTFNKTGVNSDLVVGGDDAGANGLLLFSGGQITTGRDTSVGKTDSTGVLTMSGSAVLNTNLLRIGEGGSATGTGTVNLNGGTLQTTGINGGSRTTGKIVNFNGTLIQAKAGSATFLTGLNTANIQAGGLVINSNGFALAGDQNLSGTGTVTKNGAGSLDLAGELNNLTYTGITTVNAGSLTLPTDPVGSEDSPGDVFVADGAAFGVKSQNDFGGSHLQPANITFNGPTTGTAFNANVGDVGGSLPTIALLNVTGTLTANGTVTVNLAGSELAPGQLHLIRYSGTIAGTSPSFVLGTLPNGVVGTLVRNDNFFGAGQGAIYVNIVSVSLPDWAGTDAAVFGPLTGDLLVNDPLVLISDPVASGIVTGQTVSGTGIPDGTTVTAVDDGAGEITLSNNATVTNGIADLYFGSLPGTNDGSWDVATTSNWVDQVTTASSEFSNDAPVVFDDKGFVPGVVVNTTVIPSDVVINNSDRGYVFSGNGKISGTTGLTKQGSGTAIMGLTNDYAGITKIQAGVLSIPSIADGGVGSPIGQSAAAAGNLDLAGGTLHYSGGAASTNRSFVTTAVGGGIGTDNELTITGAATTAGGNFVKSGVGSLIMTHHGANSFGDGGAADGINVRNGTLMFDGSAASQTNTVINDIWVGTEPGVAADLVFDGSSASISGYLAIARGNSTTGLTSTCTATDSMLAMGNLSLGYDNGVGGYLATSVLTLNNSSCTVAGTGKIGESNGSTASVVLNGTSTMSTSGGVGTNVGQGNGSNGTLDIKGSSAYTSNGSFYIGSDAGSTGAVLVSGSGSLAVPNGSEFRIGSDGTGALTLTGGTVSGNGWMSIGRGSPASVGTLTVSGGTFTQTATDRFIHVGEIGAGTLTISGSGAFVANSTTGVLMTDEATSSGVINLDGGSLTATAVIDQTVGSGPSIFNFNGGILRAGVAANPIFMDGIGTVTVKSGGAMIDSNGNSIAVNSALLDGAGGGGLNKSGAGSLFLNGANTYTGPTIVSAGTLGGTGSIAGPLVVNASASVAPGGSVGTFTVGGNTSIAGTYSCEIDGTTADMLAVTGDLNLTGSSLTVSANAPSGSEWVIATYTGTLTGTFPNPAGYTVDASTANQVKLISTGGSAYDIWATSKGLTGANNGAAQDPEFDGIKNELEFVLGGNPLASDTSILPVLTTDATNFHFTFNRADESESEITLTFQYGSSLTGWTPVAIGAISAGQVTVMENGALPDTVEVTIPKGSNTKLFGRLKAVK